MSTISNESGDTAKQNIPLKEEAPAPTGLPTVLKIESIINTVSYQELKEAKCRVCPAELEFVRASKRFVIKMETLGLPSDWSKLLHRNRLGKPDLNALKSAFIKAVWFSGALLGPKPRPQMPSADDLLRGAPKFVYPTKETAYDEIFDAIKMLANILKGAPALPLKEYYVAVLEVMVNLWPRLTSSGKKRAYYFLEVIAKETRRSGANPFHVSKFTRVHGDYFPSRSTMLAGFPTSKAWAGMFDGSINVRTLPQRPVEVKPTIQHPLPKRYAETRPSRRDVPTPEIPEERPASAISSVGSAYLATDAYIKERVDSAFEFIRDITNESIDMYYYAVGISVVLQDNGEKADDIHDNIINLVRHHHNIIHEAADAVDAWKLANQNTGLQLTAALNENAELEARVAQLSKALKDGGLYVPVPPLGSQPPSMGWFKWFFTSIFSGLTFLPRKVWSGLKYLWSV